MDVVCGQIRQQPTQPGAQACYDAAWAWLESHCSGCQGDATCEAGLRLLYQLKLADCDEAHSEKPDEHVRKAIRDLHDLLMRRGVSRRLNRE